MRLAHAYASKGVGDRYLPTAKQRRGLHRQLGLWWEGREGREASGRMANELNAQLCLGQAWEDLVRCLTDARTGIALVSHVNALTLFGTWSELAARRGSSSIASLVESQLGEAWPVWRGAVGSTTEARRSLARFSDFLALIGSAQQLAELVAKEGLDIAREHARESEDPECLQALLESLQNVASVMKSKGSLGEAILMYEEGLVIARSLAEPSCSTKFNAELVISLLQIAEIERMRGEIERAYERCQEALGLARRLGARSSALESGRLLGVCLNKVGRLEQMRGGVAAAMSSYGESLVLARQLVDRYSSPQCSRDLSVCLQLVAGVERLRGDLDA